MTISGRPDVRQLRPSLPRTVPRSLGPRNYQLFSPIRLSLWPSRPPYRLIWVITDSGAASLHRRYPASLVLPTPPPPSRLSADFPVLPVIRPTFAPPISQRGEEGFSSCLARPRHRAVATTPPECRSASASLRCVILLSSSEGGLSLPGFDVSGPPLRSLALRPGDSPTTLTVTCRWASKSQFPFSLPSKLRGSGSFPGGLVPR